MTWIKLEDSVADHPKIAGLSDRAFRWWIRSLCYCSRFLTDGVIPGVFLVGVKPNIRAELIAAKLWIERDSRLEIHDYLQHQTSRAQVEAERLRNRNRRNASGRTAGTTTGTTAGGTEEKPRPESREQIQRTDTENRKSVERAPVQGSGAFAPNSLPRDHMHHALCGQSMLICLKTWEYNTLAKQLNNPDVHATRAVISQFVEVLEKGVTPNESIGPFSWVEKNFQTYLKSIGKAPAPLITAAKPRGVAEILAEREAAKGKAS